MIETLSDKVGEKNEHKLTPEEVLQNFAESMRKHDRLLQQAKELGERKKPFELLLESIDLGNDPDSYPAEFAYAELAYNALPFVLITKRLEAVEKEIADNVLKNCISLSPYSFGTSPRQKFEVNTANPDKYRMGLFDGDRYGSKTFLGKFADGAKGEIIDIHLNLDTGGFLNVWGKRGNIYQAYPLIDRENDYKPAFSIETL